MNLVLLLELIHQNRRASVTDLVHHLVLDRDARHFRLETAFLAAVADDLVIEIGRMAELSGKSRAAVVEFAVDDDADGHASAQVQVNDVLFLTGASLDVLSVAARAGIVLDQHAVSEAFFHDFAQRLFLMSEIFVASPRFRIDATGHANADTQQLGAVDAAAGEEILDRRANGFEALVRIVEREIALAFRLDDIVLKVRYDQHDLVAANLDSREIDRRVGQAVDVGPATAAGLDLAPVGDNVLGEQLLDQLGDRRNADVQLLGQIGERRIAGDGHMSDNITFDDVVLLNNAFSLSMLRPVEKFL